MAFQQFPQKGGIPSGNTSQRPAGAIEGDTFYNGQLGLLEIYSSGQWIPCSAPAGIPTVTATDVGTSRAYGSGAIAFTFVPGTNGGSPYGYIGNAVLGAVAYTTGTTTSSSITLTVANNGSYAVSGSAYNGFGTSPASIPLTLDVTTVPQAPTIGSVTVDTDIVVSWTNNNSGGKAITAIKVNAYDGATLTSTTTAATTSSTSATITGLTVGTAYTFKVFASNANGDGLESSATTSVTVGPVIDYLVVAGGASGGAHQAAGGGAGGLRSTVTATGGGGTLESAKRLFKGVAYTITVGNGGSAVSGSTNITGLNGGTSSISGTGLTTISSVGGGGGGGFISGTGNNGGSGGGEASNGSGGAHVVATGTANQGFNGGIGYHVSPHGGGGGGGAGAVGGDANQSGTGQGGNGGNGVAVSITGSSVTYGGGGGGSSWGSSTTVTPGTGGTGGGGNGGNSTNSGNAYPATANTGGGGGGSGTSGSQSGAGGSGVVIVRATIAAASTTGSPTYTTSGSYHIYKFTGNGSITY
jgi:hypothetical protein